jgi:hypothetical protein
MTAPNDNIDPNVTPDTPEGNQEPAEVTTMSEAQLRDELARVRRESASRRIELRDMKAKADEWDKYQQSQLTEQEKLAERAAQAERERDQLKAEKVKLTVLKAHGLDDSDIEFLTANDEEGLKAQAARLAARAAANQPNSNPALDLLAGKRGAPLGSATPSIDDMIRASARR